MSGYDKFIQLDAATAQTRIRAFALNTIEFQNERGVHSLVRNLRTTRSMIKTELL